MTSARTAVAVVQWRLPVLSPHCDARAPLLARGYTGGLPVGRPPQMLQEFRITKCVVGKSLRAVCYTFFPFHVRFQKL